MKKKGQKIEVRFFDTAEFQVAPIEAAFSNDDCADVHE